MNILRRFNSIRNSTCRYLATKTSVRLSSTPSSSPSVIKADSKIFLENLSTHRSLIRIRGNEVDKFVQGLVTNDINHLSKPNADSGISALFLNKGGRILYDALIYKRSSEEETLLIECDKCVSENLMKHLRLFRVRKKIEIDCVANEFNVWTVFTEGNEQIKFSASDEENLTMKNVFHLPDPRLKLLGSRLIIPHDIIEANILKLLPNVQLSSSGYTYKEHRYRLGVGEGIVELKTEKSFPFEANCDYLHGISFHKGCYLGQELTARTYHTGVIRKRLMPIQLAAECTISDADANCLIDASINNEEGQAVGKLRGIGRRWALGLLRLELALKSKKLTINDIEGSTSRPTWWPIEAPKQTKPSVN